MKRKPLLVAATAACLALVASPALAEGSWTSNIQQWNTGKASRTWADKNVDSASTTIRLDKCTNYLGGGIAVSAALKLMHERGGILPDENLGEKTFNCQSSATNSWGRVTDGNFHFTLTKIAGQSGDGVLNASYVQVNY